ncbi:MAG: serine/threonine protein kinase [Acidimicrobiales bacterium]|nr:serine/threonine protein kinase [Acidimicrobiales bacterium]
MTERKPLDPPELAGYTYIERIGTGGFSEVFLYEQQFPRQKVAIKVLAQETLGEDSRQRFTDEANVMASLSSHPYIVAISHADISPSGHPFLVMQYYPRPNFNVRARTERFSVAAVLRAGVQVASAVESAHRSGVLHRDLKPANILTSEYGQPGLTDFGIAVAADQRMGEAEGMSIPWSPPEVVAGSGLTDERADIYSLAATLYTLIAGRSPFEVPGGSNRSIDLIDRIRRSKPSPFERGDVPDSLWRLLLQSMNKDPGSRPASAADFARALQVIEVEQRFDMTPFEVSEAHEPPSAGDPIDADAGSTRVKDVGVIESQARPSAPPATSTSTSHEAFRPTEVENTRTTKRRPDDAVVAPVVARADLIHATPFVPDETPAPPVARPSAELAEPRRSSATSSSYVAAQAAPIAAPGSGSLRPMFVVGVVAAGVVVVLAVLGVLVATGAFRDTAPPTTTSTTIDQDPTTGVLVPPGALKLEKLTGQDSYLVSWTAPDGVVPTDKYVMEDNAGQEYTMSAGQLSQQIENVGNAPCVVIKTVRDGRYSDPVAKGNC